MAATVKGTQYSVGVGTVTLAEVGTQGTSSFPVEYSSETGEVSEVVRDGDGAAAARVIKDTFVRYTIRLNYTAAASVIAAGSLLTLNGTKVYVESTRVSRSENPAIMEITAVKEAGITYS